MHWTETVTIDAPVDVARAAVRDQRHVMAWSAWPEATGFTCSVDGDATSVGSEIVFRDRTGTVQGRQHIVDVTDDGDTRTVVNQLENRGPFGRTMRPRVDFRTTAVNAQRTEVGAGLRRRHPVPTAPAAAGWSRDAQVDPRAAPQGPRPAQDLRRIRRRRLHRGQLTWRGDVPTEAGTSPRKRLRSTG